MSLPLERRNFLLGALAGVSTGAAAGVAAGTVQSHESVRAWWGGGGFVSYAQQGEDLVLRGIFQVLRIAHPTYIDIGAYDPITGSNTYLLYKTGSRGVLVEPNPARTPKLREVRPGDVVLEIGIGARAEDEEADYYVVQGDGQLNTFSPEEVERLPPNAVRGVIKRRLVNVNKVMGESFHGKSPDLFSCDAEGYDLTILSTLDFDRFRPRVFCVETLEGLEPENRIGELLKAHDYVLRGGTFVNGIFVDARVLWELERRPAASPG
jgi:hypothetical protein